MTVLVDRPAGLLRLWSVQLQALWGAMCTVYVAMPPEQQHALLGFFGVTAEGGAVAVQYFAAVSAAFSAATIAARAVRQPSIHADREA